MKEYNFKPADDADAFEILSLYRSLINTPGCTWNLDYPDEKIIKTDIKNEFLYILKDDNKIIAAVTICQDKKLGQLNNASEKTCDLSRLAVSLEFQRQGIATIILQKVISDVKQKGFDTINMIVSKSNFPAISLYNKNGFEKMGETFMYGIEFYYYQMNVN